MDISSSLCMWPDQHFIHTHTFHRVCNKIPSLKNVNEIEKWDYRWEMMMMMVVLYFNKLREASGSSGEFPWRKFNFPLPITHNIFAHNRTLINLKNESVALHPHDAILLTLTYLSLLQGTKHITWQLFTYDAQTNYIMGYNFSFISQQTSSCVLFEHENLIFKIVYVNLLVFIMTKKRFCLFKALLTLKILFFDT